MVYVLVITIMNGAIFPPDKKIAGVYQDEATCEKYRNAMAFAVTDTRFKSSIKFSCDHGRSKRIDSMAAYLYIRPTTKSGKFQIVRKAAGNRFYVIAEAFNEPAAESIVASLNTNNVMIPENPIKKAS